MTRPIALITGATGGLGIAFAEYLGRRGFDLVLTARREAELNKVAETIQTKHGTECTVIPCDLASPTARAELVAEIASKNLTIEMLINNAGFGAHGKLAETEPSTLTGMIDLNCTALTDLTRQYLPGMLERKHGTIIQVASTAAFQPLPEMGVYAATKAYVVSMTQALHSEIKGSGVRVLALCPGPTETPFWEVADATDVMTNRRSSEQVIETCFAALSRGKTVVVDGAFNGFQAMVAKVMPYAIVEPVAKRITKRQ